MLVYKRCELAGSVMTVTWSMFPHSLVINPQSKPCPLDRQGEPWKSYTNFSPIKVNLKFLPVTCTN